MHEEALQHFKKTDPILFNASIKFGLSSIQPVDDYFLKLVRSIVGQQLSVKAASTIYSRFESIFPKKKITPEKILKLDKEKIRACGISYSKIEYIKDLSQKVLGGNLNLKNIYTLENEEIIIELTKVKGIGPWSAEMFLMFGLGRPDIFSTGDLGLKNAIKKLYGLDDVTNDEMIKLSEKWSPYRTYACMVLWRSLDNAPK